MKPQIRLDDPETRAIWESAKQAQAEFESWPAWKRGEYPTESTKTESSAEPDTARKRP